MSESRCIPRAFAYVPSFHQIHQLTEKSKSKGKVQQQHPIDQTIDFFPLKTAEKKESGLSVIGSKANEETAEFWSDLQNDCIWESVVDFTYSLCSNIEGLQETCLQVYAKVKQKKSKKLATLEISGLHSSESDLCDSHLQKKIPENCQNLWKSHLFSDRKRDSTKHNHQNADGYSQTSVERPGGSDGVDNSSQSRERKPGKKVGTCLQFTNKKLLMRSGDHNSHSGISVESLTEHDNSTNLSDKASGRVKKFFQDTEEKLNESEKLEGSQESVKSCSSTLETGCQKGKRRGADSDQQNCKETETQSKSSGSVSGQQLCPIQTDECFMDKLAKTPGPSWMNDEDIQLVQLLINSLGSGTSKMNGKVGVRLQITLCWCLQDPQ